MTIVGTLATHSNYKFHFQANGRIQLWKLQVPDNKFWQYGSSQFGNL